MDILRQPEYHNVLDVGPSPSEHETMEILALIVAEFKSDPQSVACFDFRTVARAIKCVDDYEEKHAKYFKKYGRDPKKW